MPDYDRIVILLTRRVAGELTPTEAEELRLALEQDPKLNDLVAAIEGLTVKEDRILLERGLRQWKQRAAGLPVINTAPPPQLPISIPRRAKFRWSAAAAVVLLATSVYFLKKTPIHQPAPVIWHEMAAKYGTRNYIDLPDGSRMWLNAGSKVRYADGFSNGKRELTLIGEAYFDIRHEPEIPFLIHVGNMAVNVLGTTLNIKAYPGDSIIETTLIQGKAEIEVPGKNSSPIMLQPGEKITIPTGPTPPNPSTSPSPNTNTASTYQRRNVVADPTYKTIIETSWVEDKLVFRKEPFRQVATQLERWYNIRIRFENNKYQNEELTGYFKDQPIKNVMDALQLSLGFHYEIAGDSISIH